MVEPRKMPDFKLWKRTGVHSIFWDGREEGTYFTSTSQSDPQEAYWLGYCQHYEDASGNFHAQEWYVFNKAPVMRIWGLKKEDKFQYIALRSADRAWAIFPTSVYHLGVSETYDKQQKIVVFTLMAYSEGDPPYFQCRVSVKR